MRHTSFELGCHTIKIEYVKTIMCPEKGVEIFGNVCEKTNTVKIATHMYDVELVDDVLQHTLCHELGHLLMLLTGQFKLYKNEVFIDQLGNYISQFMKTLK